MREEKFTNHASRITHHESRITHHASRITHHESPHHVSRITFHSSRFHCRLALELLPSHCYAAQRGQGRLDRHVIHQLAIEESLPEQPHEHALVLGRFKQECDHRRGEL